MFQFKSMSLGFKIENPQSFDKNLEGLKVLMFKLKSKSFNQVESMFKFKEMT